MNELQNLCIIAFTIDNFTHKNDTAHYKSPISQAILMLTLNAIDLKIIKHNTKCEWIIHISDGWMVLIKYLFKWA